MTCKHSAFIENTPEIREWLESIGYKKHGDYRPHGSLLLAFTSSDSNEPYYISFNDYHSDLYTNDNDINCLGNPELFKAVTAICSNINIGKYFINSHTGQWQRCDYNMATDEI